MPPVTCHGLHTECFIYRFFLSGLRGLQQCFIESRTWFYSLNVTIIQQSIPQTSKQTNEIKKKPLSLEIQFSISDLDEEGLFFPKTFPKAASWLALHKPVPVCALVFTAESLLFGNISWLFNLNGNKQKPQSCPWMNV